MTDIYTLGIKADTTDIDRGKKSLDKFSTSADKADKKTKQLREGVNVLGKAVVAVGAVAATAMGAIAVSSANAGREIEKLSRLAGATEENFQRMAFAARAYGVDQEKLSDILKDTQDKMGDFISSGAGEMVDFFEKIAPQVGVTAENFRNLNGKDSLQLYVSTLEKANLSQSEMVFYLEAIANDATLLQPLLANNGAEFERLAKRADDLGIVLDNIDLQNLKEMKAALDELGSVSTAASNIIGATLAPFIADLSNKMLDSAGNADELRETIISLAGAGVTVAGVFADAGRVFEIFGKSIGAAVFTAVEEFNTLDARLDLLGATFELTFDELTLMLIEWVNEQDAALIKWAENMVNALDVFDLFDDVTFEAQPWNTAALEASITTLTAQVTDYEGALTNSNKNIANAWQDVIDLISQPIPSDGMDAWFDKIVEGIDAQRALRAEIEKTGDTNNNITNGMASDAVKWISNTKDVTKGLNAAFGENEKAAKALHRVNAVIGIAEQAMILQKVFADSAATQVHLANSAAKSSANATEAITSAAAAPFPTGFAAAAAMIGLMASVLGGSGGGSVSAPSISEQRQETQGTGSVFGSDDKSQSILDSQERFEDINIDQLAELRGIRTGINSMAAGISRLAGSVIAGGIGEFGGDLSGSRAGESSLGKIASGEFLGIDFGGLGESFLTGLFGSTKKRVVDSGIEFISQTLGEVIEGGAAQAQAFFDIETTKKKLFGLSKKTSTSTEFQSLDQAINDQITSIFGNIGDVITESVVLLGLDTQANIEEAVSNFNLDIGKISFEGLSGEEIESELQAIFSQQADLITQSLVPSLTDFQQIGEGLFDTLTRVTHEQAAFNDSVAAMGFSLSELSGLMQIEISQSIIGLLGGLDEFATASSGFASGFFSDAEKMELLGASLSDVFAQLGTPLTTTRDGFRDLIESLDLTDESQRAMFATLLQIAPAMDDYISSIEDVASALQNELDNAASDAFDMLSKSIKLERDRVAEVLAGQKEIFRDEIARINGVRSALQETLAALTLGVEDAKTGVELAFAAERAAIEITSALRIDGFEAERVAAQSLHDINIDNINAQKSAVQDTISTLGSLADRLRGALPGNDAQTSLEQALVSARRGSFGAASALDVGSLGRDASQFSTLEQFNIAQGITTSQTSELANLIGGQLSIEERTLATLERQEEAERIAFTKQNEAIDERILAEQQATELTLSLMDSQLAAILGIDTGVLTVDESINALRVAQAAFTALDFENQMLALAQEEELAAEALDQAEDFAREQNAQLDLVINTGRAQLNALFRVNTSVLTIADAVAQLESTIKAADANTQAANAAIAKSSASTAKILQRNELNAETV